MNCIDLEKRFPGCQIGYEDPSLAATQEPWHKIIVCRHGHISPSGGDKLWACTNTRGKAARALLSGDLPCVVMMEGDDGVNAEFDVKNYQLFFELMGAKR